jgi:hypothetical protein
MINDDGTVVFLILVGVLLAFAAGYSGGSTSPATRTMSNRPTSGRQRLKTHRRQQLSSAGVPGMPPTLRVAAGAACSVVAGIAQSQLQPDPA